MMWQQSSAALEPPGFVGHTALVSATAFAMVLLSLAKDGE